MSMRVMVSAMIASACLLLAATGWSRPSSPRSRPRTQTAKKKAPKRRAAAVKTYRPATRRLRFEDELVAAGRASGNGSIIFSDPRKHHPVLNIIRENFLPELIKSAHTI